MRKELFGIGNFIHVYNRGNRKTEIVRDTRDKWRFLQALRFFNDSHSSLNVLRDLIQSNPNLEQANSVFKLGWPADWPEKDPLVKILCYCLMPNHFHLLLKEIREDGVSKFMQKFGTGFTNYFNLKYKEVGSLFQGSYKAKVVDGEIYLEYLSVYIQVLNVLELFPGGLQSALGNLDEALKFVEEYPFSSYADYVGLRKSLIIDKDVLADIFPSPEDYREFTHNIILTKDIDGILEDLKME